MLTKEELPECPVATTVSLIGSKWKLLIIRNLLERPWRFNELKKNLEYVENEINQNERNVDIIKSGRCPYRLENES